MLVHGAFAESSRWDQVIDPLLDAGYPVTAVANPLRALASGAACVRSIEGPVLLVAHPYGGAVMTSAGARRTVEIPTASHAAAVSHPDATARLILEAVAAVPVAA